MRRPLVALLLGLAVSGCSESADEPMVAVDCTVYVEARYPDAKPVTGFLISIQAHKSDGDGHPIAGSEITTSCFTDAKGDCSASFGYNLGGTKRQWAVVRVSMVVRGTEVQERTTFTPDDAPSRTHVVRLTAAE